MTQKVGLLLWSCPPTEDVVGGYVIDVDIDIGEGGGGGVVSSSSWAGRGRTEDDLERIITSRGSAASRETNRVHIKFIKNILNTLSLSILSSTFTLPSMFLPALAALSSFSATLFPTATNPRITFFLLTKGAR
jgi:hypothetical protein